MQIFKKVDEMKTVIDSANFQGYLWYSDELTPEVFDGSDEKQIILDDEKNPFVVEGNLYDRENEKSVNIRYIDGKYLVTSFNLAEMKNNPDFVLEDEPYLTNSRILSMTGKLAPECGRSLYKRIWHAEEDNLNGNWKSLRPVGLAFAGFIK